MLAPRAAPLCHVCRCFRSVNMHLFCHLESTAGCDFENNHELGSNTAHWYYSRIWQLRAERKHSLLISQNTEIKLNRWSGASPHMYVGCCFICADSQICLQIPKHEQSAGLPPVYQRKSMPAQAISCRSSLELPCRGEHLLCRHRPKSTRYCCSKLGTVSV